MPADLSPQPLAVNVHNHMCLEGNGQGGNEGECNPTLDVTNTSLVFYNDLNAFLSKYGLSSNSGRRIVFGETTTDQNCDGHTQAMARQSGNALRSSSLWQNHAAQLVIRPWNYLGGACYESPSFLRDAYRVN